MYLYELSWSLIWCWICIIFSIPCVRRFFMYCDFLSFDWLAMICCAIVRSDLVPAYVRLLRDNEAEVRIAAAGKVTKFCKILSPELAIQHILPCVKVDLLTFLIFFFLFMIHLRFIYYLVYLIFWSLIIGFFPSVGIVIRFFTACSICFGFSYNGDGTSFGKGKKVI